MSNEKNIPDILFDSKIKELRLELPNHSFSHSSPETPFVGRKQIFEKLKSLIEDDKNKTGVYLVTGNRGVGKTRLVDKIIEKKQKRSLYLRINFGHNLKDEKDILRLIVHTLNIEYTKSFSRLRY